MLVKGSSPRSTSPRVGNELSVPGKASPLAPKSPSAMRRASSIERSSKGSQRPLFAIGTSSVSAMKPKPSTGIHAGERSRDASSSLTCLLTFEGDAQGRPEQEDVAAQVIGVG